MVTAIAILATITGLANSQPAGEKPPGECCETKTVGGVTYTLSGQMDTKMYNCLNDCVYQKEGQTGAKFCFAMGDEKVECTDEQMGGSDKPPMEGSEKPTMEGSDKPPVGEESSQAPDPLPTAESSSAKPPSAGSGQESGSTAKCPETTIMSKCNVDCNNIQVPSESSVNSNCLTMDGQKRCETTWTINDGAPAGTALTLKCPSATPAVDVTTTCTNGEWKTEGLPAVCAASAKPPAAQPNTDPLPTAESSSAKPPPAGSGQESGSTAKCPETTIMNKCNVDCNNIQVPSESSFNSNCLTIDGQKRCETTWTINDGAPAGTALTLKCPSATPAVDVTTTCTNGEWKTEGLPAVCAA